MCKNAMLCAVLLTVGCAGLRGQVGIIPKITQTLIVGSGANDRGLFAGALGKTGSFASAQKIHIRDADGAAARWSLWATASPTSSMLVGTDEQSTLFFAVHRTDASVAVNYTDWYTDLQPDGDLTRKFGASNRRWEEGWFGLGRFYATGSSQTLTAVNPGLGGAIYASAIYNGATIEAVNESAGGQALKVSNVGGGIAIYATTNGASNAVSGLSSSGYGVSGGSSTGSGVYGYSTSEYGVRAATAASHGVAIYTDQKIFGDTINAGAGFTALNDPGQTVTITVKGSDGNNCTIIYKFGLKIGGTCN